jgi:hypothetical protein
VVKKLSILLLTGFLLLMVSAVKGADAPLVPVTTDTYGVIDKLDDGRLNGYDVGAPVAIYYKYDAVKKADGKTYNVLRGIEMLGIDKKTNAGYLILDAAVDHIAGDVKDANKKDVTIVDKNGYTLNYSPSGWFWVTTPPDAEGKVYTFKWQNLTVPVTGG